MRINGLDHVNISTPDIASSVRYYTELFNLQARNVPAANLTQIFTRDPHGVLLELNFSGD